VEEEEDKEEKLLPYDDEENDKVKIIMAHVETKPKHPMGTRILKRIMIKEENKFQEKDKAFKTYKRKSRNFHIEKEVDPTQQKDYGQIECSEAQEK